ncbi:MAG: helix-turn-helix domain-containing protein [Bacteroidota bacterium]
MKKRTDNVKLIFALKLKQLRLDKKLSQGELSTKAGVSVSYLNEIEKGKKYPKADKIFSLADALNVSYDHLVSLKLSKKLSPLSELLQSDILNDLPLDFFDIDSARVIELLSNAPTKLSAFINTFIEMARNYDMSVENFYFSVLRSYQELHDNHFEELEAQSRAFADKFRVNTGMPLLKQLEQVLTDEYGYAIEMTDFQKDPELNNTRYILIPEKLKLIVNDALSEHQKIFVLAKEVGFCFMALKNRPITNPILELNSFDEVLNNFKASYFASALIIEEQKFIEDMKAFFTRDTFDGSALEKVMKTYQATPETFVQRMISIIPKHLGLRELFFLKFKRAVKSDRFEMTKELHLSKLHYPHATVLNEHYCRRWVSLNVLNELRDAKPSTEVLCSAQISKNIDLDQECLMISFGSRDTLNDTVEISTSIGLIINDKLKGLVRFLDDPKLSKKDVNTTCERCANQYCGERMAEPTLHLKEKLEKQRKMKIQELYLS